MGIHTIPGNPEYLGSIVEIENNYDFLDNRETAFEYWPLISQRCQRNLKLTENRLITYRFLSFISGQTHKVKIGLIMFYLTVFLIFAL